MSTVGTEGFGEHACIVAPKYDVEFIGVVRLASLTLKFRYEDDVEDLKPIQPMITFC